MSTGNINSGSLSQKVKIDWARARTAPDNSFSTVMGRGLQKAADTALTAASIAAPFVPGGAVVSAAITGAGRMKDSISGGSLGSASGGYSLAASGANASTLSMGGSSGVGGLGGSAMAAVDGMAAGGDSSAVMFSATRELQELNQSFNLQYLGLQQKMQADNRQFTALSNIMKTKHDTAKNAISNVR